MKMRKIFCFITAFLITMVFVSCEKDETPSLERFEVLNEQLAFEDDGVTLTGTYVFAGKIDSLKVRVSTDSLLMEAKDYPAVFGEGTFSAKLEVVPGYLYYYCYVLSYGAQEDYLTEVDTFSWPLPAYPVGAIDGLFSVDGHTQVYFSRGNLQYNPSLDLWRFAERQMDYVGDDNYYIYPTYQGWIDLFGWATSGWDNGNQYYQPYNYERDTCSLQGYGYGPLCDCDLTGVYENADWGVYNAISNGGDAPSLWRTLSHEEWTYLLDSRETPSGIRFAFAQVDGINGIVLLPDDWTPEFYVLYKYNEYEERYVSNLISMADWEEKLEAHGAVFLPAGGGRVNLDIHDVNNYGMYWSTSCYREMRVYMLNFCDTYLGLNDHSRRYSGRCVRLVQEVSSRNHDVE